MGLILCQQEPIKHPFYLETLGVHLYSSQELCYIIFHYPLIALDHFLSEGLIRFIRQELKLGVLALKLERGMSRGDDVEDLLLLILQECDYYPASEVSRFQRKMIALQNMNAADYAKAKADDLADRRQYGKAITQYERLLNNHGENYERKKWRGEVWNNLGVVYARLFQFEKAMHAFEQAYSYCQNPEMIKQIYVLRQLQPQLPPSEQYLSLVTGEQKKEWDQELSEQKKMVLASEQGQRIDRIFKKDSKTRRQMTEAFLEEWKQEYRKMV